MIPNVMQKIWKTLPVSFSQILKNLILGPFWTLSAQKFHKKIYFFLAKMELRHFLSYMTYE